MKKLKESVLAEGEVTGHAHRLPENVQVFESDAGERSFSVQTEVPLSHEEHGCILIPPGDYVSDKVVEYDPLCRAGKKSCRLTRRERIYQKYGGRCAYSGTPLEPDWQIDHVEPVQRFWDGRIAAKSRDCEENMVPCQRAINNYKWSYPLEYFRLVLLGKLHFRLRKYPYSGKGGERRK
jgi:hypothetical protein